MFQEKIEQGCLCSEWSGTSGSGLLGVGQLKAGNTLEVHHLQHVLGLCVHLDNVQLEGGHVRNVVVPALALLLLELDGDSANG